MSADFEAQIRAYFPSIDDKKSVLIAKYREAVLQENEIQNLTRLTSEEDFLESHIWDTVDLLKSGFLEYPALDLGSGMGIPGLLAAIIEPKPWILAESEKRKADFLRRVVETLRLDHVQVISDRAENYLRRNAVGSVVARAVGPVGRIWGWIGKCSTWNNLILLKSRGWDEEWQRFLEEEKKAPLEIRGFHKSEVGVEKKVRILVSLARRIVLRGTIPKKISK